MKHKNNCGKQKKIGAKGLDLAERALEIHEILPRHFVLQFENFGFRIIHFETNKNDLLVVLVKCSFLISLFR